MKKNRGFIKTIIIIVVALALLKYFFDFDILEFLRSDAVKNVFGTIWHIISTIWNDYLKESVAYVWNEIIVGTLWEGIQDLSASLDK